MHPQHHSFRFLIWTAYRDIVIFEPSRQCPQDSLFVLCLDDPWRSSEDAERPFSLWAVLRLAESKQSL